MNFEYVFKLINLLKVSNSIECISLSKFYNDYGVYIEYKNNKKLHRLLDHNITSPINIIEEELERIIRISASNVKISPVYNRATQKEILNMWINYTLVWRRTFYSSAYTMQPYLKVK